MSVIARSCAWRMNSIGARGVDSSRFHTKAFWFEVLMIQ